VGGLGPRHNRCLKRRPPCRRKAEFVGERRLCQAGLVIVSTSSAIAPVPLTIGSGEPAFATIRFSAA